MATGSYFGYGKPERYRELIRGHLSTALPTGLSSECYARRSTPPDLTFSEDDRDREMQRRLVYHRVLSVPGDKQADMKWAREFTESLLREVASYGNGVMMAYSLIDSWRQLLFISHLPDDGAPDWEKNAPNTPYLAWSRMQLSLNMLVVPNQSLSDLLREELQKAQTLTGRLGSYIRRTLGSNLNMARLVCLLAELEDLGSALEEIIVHWKKELAAGI